MRRYIAAILLGYTLGAVFRLKPFYVLEYYLPGELNPWVEKYNGPYIWSDDSDGLECEERRQKRNADYYNALLKKINE